MTETPGSKAFPDPTTPLGPEGSRTARQFAVGVAAGIGMVAVWGSWAAITRKGALAIDLPVLVLVRFLVPAIVFLPVTLRIGLVPKHVRTGELVLMVLGSGVFFFLCAAWALWLAPVAEVGPLMPAAPPLFVALYMALRHGHKFRAVQIGGLVLIALGIVVIVGLHMWQTHEILAGHFLALLAALLWAAYTVAFRRSGMSALECAALVSTWSAFAAVPFGISFLIDEWQDGHQFEILAQVAMQGIGSGVIAVLLYGISIRTLGAPEAAAMVALSSVVSVALAVPLLGEIPQWTTVAGIVAMTAGVVLTNWREPRRATAEAEADWPPYDAASDGTLREAGWPPDAFDDDGRSPAPAAENPGSENPGPPDWLKRMQQNR